MDDPGLLHIHEIFMRAEADWAERLVSAVDQAVGALAQPSPELMELVERYVPSAEVKAIASFLFMLRACGVESGEKIQHLAELHDADMDRWLADPARMKKWGRKEEAIREAKFSTGETLRQNVYSFRPNSGHSIGLDAQSFGRFLVEFKNKTQIRESLVMLAELGYLTTERVGPRSNIYRTTGLIENLYESHLAAMKEEMRQLK